MHTLPRIFPQPLNITHGWFTKELFVLTVEVGGIVIAHTIARMGRMQALAEHELTRFLEPELLLKLQGTHGGQRSEVVVEVRGNHPQRAQAPRSVPVG
jgi:hypothetical protein